MRYEVFWPWRVCGVVESKVLRIGFGAATKTLLIRLLVNETGQHFTAPSKEYLH